MVLDEARRLGYCSQSGKYSRCMMRAGRLEARRLRARREALARRAILGPTPLQRVQGATLYHSPLHHSPTTYHFYLQLTHLLIHSLICCESKALHAALVQRYGKAAVPALPPGDPFSLLRSPAIEGDFLRARAAALHTFLQQLLASPLTAGAAETRTFLDTEARHPPPGTPPTATRSQPYPKP